MPGSSNQGSLSGSPSNPPPQPQPQHAQVPLVPELGQASGASQLPHLHVGLGQVPRGEKPPDSGGTWKGSGICAHPPLSEPGTGRPAPWDLTQQGEEAGTGQSTWVLGLDLDSSLGYEINEQCNTGARYCEPLFPQLLSAYTFAPLYPPQCSNQ